MSRFLTDSLDGIEIIRANSVIKHGTHDQKTHGNWATGGMGAGVADSILSRVRENGGLSVNMVDGSEPTSGYMVAKGAQFGSVVSADDFYDPIKGPKILADYMKKHKKELGGGKNYLGLWHNKDDGQVYLDVSENIQDRERAISAGQKQDQISIWDVTNFAEIETGGTGNVEKTGSGRTAKEHRRNERFRNRSLRPKNLGEVGKAYKVIRFEAGLIPILKHQEHDQSTHGNWAKAGYSEDQQRRMKEFQGVGPSLQDILSILNGAEQPGSQDLIDYVNNDQEEYKLATEGIDERVAERLANLQAEFPNHEYTEQEKSTIYEDIQEEMIQEHVDADDGSIARAWQEQNGGGGATPEELLPFFEEVYNFEHTGLNVNGVEHTIVSQVKTVEYEYGRLIVKGYLTNEDNSEIGRFERQFYVDEDGNVAVEHKLFTFYDDGSREEYAGTGFGKEFILNQEAWATQAGIDNITVFTGWDGARHWARAGYDWDEANIDISFEEIVNRADNFFTPDSPERAQFDDIIDRATVGYMPMSLTESGTDSSTFTGVRDMADDDFPIPAEIANIGYTPGAKTWVGKELLDNLNIYYKKNLQTAEGQSIIQGPVDRDGDGLVYDGTPREKPAPSKQGQDVAMSREQKLQAITDNYLANAVDFDGLTDEEESKIMDGVSTILQNNKQELLFNPLLCRHGGYCS